MTDAIQRYRDALARLVESGKPINRDSVALEAGRGRGAIKPRARTDEARAKLVQLIADIEEAEARRLQVTKHDAGKTDVPHDVLHASAGGVESGRAKASKARVAKLTEERDEARNSLHAALRRELALLKQLVERNAELALLRGGKVVPFRVHDENKE